LEGEEKAAEPVVAAAYVSRLMLARLREKEGMTRCGLLVDGGRRSEKEGGGERSEEARGERREADGEISRGGSGGSSTAQDRRFALVKEGKRPMHTEQRSGTSSEEAKGRKGRSEATAVAAEAHRR